VVVANTALDGPCTTLALVPTALVALEVSTESTAALHVRTRVQVPAQPAVPAPLATTARVAAGSAAAHVSGVRPVAAASTVAAAAAFLRVPAPRAAAVLVANTG